MGLDSVELIMGWEKAFAIKISDDEVKKIHTPQQAIQLISEKVGLSSTATDICLGLRAYRRIRQAFSRAINLPRQQIQLDSKVRDLLPKKQRQDIWKAIFVQVGLPQAPPLSIGAGLIFMPLTLKDVVIWSIANYPKSFVNVNECWTYHQVRSVVRAAIRDQIGIDDFRDNDDLHKDLGID